MNNRKIPLVNDQYYHIFCRSIAKYKIFNDANDYKRIIELINLYHYSEFNYKYSRFKKSNVDVQKNILDNFRTENRILAQIIAYCVMPTHLHLILKQTANNGISKFMSKVLDSYTKYFNSKHHRAGPLWEGHFKNVLIENDNQLLHSTRYLHLNATSAGLVDDPFLWEYSSLKEYCSEIFDGICQFKDVIDMSPERYKKFVLDQTKYQRSLSLIKNILIDNNSV